MPTNLLVLHPSRVSIARISISTSTSTSTATIASAPAATSTARIHPVTGAWAWAWHTSLHKPRIHNPQPSPPWPLFSVFVLVLVLVLATNKEFWSHNFFSIPPALLHRHGPWSRLLASIVSQTHLTNPVATRPSRRTPPSSHWNIPRLTALKSRASTGYSYSRVVSITNLYLYNHGILQSESNPFLLSKRCWP